MVIKYYYTILCHTNLYCIMCIWSYSYMYAYLYNISINNLLLGTLLQKVLAIWKWSYKKWKLSQTDLIFCNVCPDFLLVSGATLKLTKLQQLTIINFYLKFIPLLFSKTIIPKKKLKFLTLTQVIQSCNVMHYLKNKFKLCMHLYMYAAGLSATEWDNVWWKGLLNAN